MPQFNASISLSVIDFNFSVRLVFMPSWRPHFVREKLVFVSLESSSTFGTFECNLFIHKNKLTSNQKKFNEIGAEFSLCVFFGNETGESKSQYWNAMIRILRLKFTTFLLPN